MDLRALLESDAEAWWNLRIEALETEPFAFSKSPSEHRATPVETIAGRFRDAEDTTLNLGAFENGALVGMATFLRESGEKERHKGRVYAVFVSAAHRGRGIGRALLEGLLAHARSIPSLEQVLISVGASQTSARDLYRSLGFVTFGVEPGALKIGRQYVDEEHMILRLH